MNRESQLAAPRSRAEGLCLGPAQARTVEHRKRVPIERDRNHTLAIKRKPVDAEETVIPLRPWSEGLAVSSKHQLKMIIWTIGVALMLGTSLLYSMLEPPAIYRHRIAVAQQKHLDGGRFPASLGARLTSVDDNSAAARAKRASLPVTFPQLAIESTEVFLPCLSSSSAADPSGSQAFVPSTAKQVRLKAVGCSQQETFENIEITNSSNGFVATVFHPTRNSLLTDYIALTKTTSVLRVTFTTHTGSRITRDFTVSHAPTDTSSAN